MSVLNDVDTAQQLMDKGCSAEDAFLASKAALVLSGESDIKVNRVSKGTFDLVDGKWVKVINEI